MVVRDRFGEVYTVNCALAQNGRTSAAAGMDLIKANMVGVWCFAGGQSRRRNGKRMPAPCTLGFRPRARGLMRLRLFAHQLRGVTC